MELNREELWFWKEDRKGDRVFTRYRAGEPKLFLAAGPVAAVRPWTDEELRREDPRGFYLAQASNLGQIKARDLNCDWETAVEVFWFVEDLMWMGRFPALPRRIPTFLEKAVKGVKGLFHKSRYPF